MYVHVCMYVRTTVLLDALTPAAATSGSRMNSAAEQSPGKAASFRPSTAAAHGLSWFCVSNGGGGRGREPERRSHSCPGRQLGLRQATADVQDSRRPCSGCHCAAASLTASDYCAAHDVPTATSSSRERSSRNNSGLHDGSEGTPQPPPPPAHPGTHHQLRGHLGARALHHLAGVGEAQHCMVQRPGGHGQATRGATGITTTAAGAGAGSSSSSELDNAERDRLGLVAANGSRQVERRAGGAAGNARPAGTGATAGGAGGARNPLLLDLLPGVRGATCVHVYVHVRFNDGAA
jgi:hypothetical protein